jgi:cyanophycin synthetase
MRVVDSRRLRGPNLQTREPAAVAEVMLEPGEDPIDVIFAWRRELEALCGAIGWNEYAERAVARPFPGGVAFALPAPIDVLLEATDVNEWAIVNATAKLAGQKTASAEQVRVEFLGRIVAHGHPALRALREEALARQIPFLWDDDAVTLGMARQSVTHAMNAIPAPNEVSWESVGRIPTALVTGTNGKTTTTRLVARMAKLAGKVPGVTSTDGVAIDERILEKGDFTGGEGARLVLRHPDVEVAILETARGGILRRGLAIDACDAALITNVTSDHVGEFGVCDLETMVRTKALVGTIVRPEGRVVLNGDDPRLASLVFGARTVLFGLDASNPALLSHLGAGREVFTVRRGSFVRLAGKSETALGRVEEAPLTFGGAAPYNVQNALAAAALAFSLGFSDSAVSQALATFGAMPEDNPGRGWLVRVPNGPRILFDFGHNPAGLRGVYALARSLAGARGNIFAVHTQPGDRTAEDARALSHEIARGRPRLVVLWESPDYRRGRSPGDIASSLRESLVEAGIKKGAVAVCKDESGAVERAVTAARPTDIVLVAPHVERAAVAAARKKRSARKPHV